MSQVDGKLAKDLAKVADQICAMLADGVIPWARPWSVEGLSLMPNNPCTGKPYNGILNPIILWMEEAANNYGDSRWAGFKQWKAKGYQVAKGQKSTVIWMPMMGYGTNDVGEKFSFVRGFRLGRVFNAQQLVEPPEVPEIAKVDPADGYKDAARIVRSTGVKIKHRGGRACYNPISDEIIMPPAGAFDTVADYWAVVLHELSHATGAAHRLNRPGIVEFTGFGTEAYANEELVAEIGSAFLGHRLGIHREGLLEHHASYIASWHKRIKKDPQSLMDAISEAGKIVRWVEGWD